jgi:hypothetical protein
MGSEARGRGPWHQTITCEVVATPRDLFDSRSSGDNAERGTIRLTDLRLLGETLEKTSAQPLGLPDSTHLMTPRSRSITADGATTRTRQLDP